MISFIRLENVIMDNKNFIRLTPTQMNILQLLLNGGSIIIDRMNTASVCGKVVSPNTRYFLTKNKLVTRMNKTKPIYSKGNGYIISDKGEVTLISNMKIIRRQTPRILLQEKECARCRIIQPVSFFVSIYGFKNPRGKYCENCFHKSQREQAILLLEGRDFCLYCGRKIDRVYEWTVNGKSVKTYINRDHMDPTSLGGKDKKSNTVYCCRECNLKKGKKTYTEWLSFLKPEYSFLARDIYIKKHKRTPEKFKPTSDEFSIAISIG